MCVFAFFYTTAGFDITKIQLSYWGSKTEYKLLWNVSLVILSVSMFFNIRYYISSIPSLIYKKRIQTWFILVLSSLALTGIVDMTHKLHDLTAYVYFFSYPLVIFLMAFFNRHHLQFKEWRYHMVFSLSMILLPLISLNLFPGKAITEVIHIIVVMFWNLWILI